MHEMPLSYFTLYTQVQVSWKHNDEDIKFIERTNIEHIQKNGDASLIISDVKEEDLGIYLCTGGNEKGTAETVIMLSGKPI